MAHSRAPGRSVVARRSGICCFSGRTRKVTAKTRALPIHVDNLSGKRRSRPWNGYADRFLVDTRNHCFLRQMGTKQGKEALSCVGDVAVTYQATQQWIFHVSIEGLPVFSGGD